MRISEKQLNVIIENYLFEAEYHPDGKYEWMKKNGKYYMTQSPDDESVSRTNPTLWTPKKGGYDTVVGYFGDKPAKKLKSSSKSSGGEMRLPIILGNQASAKPLSNMIGPMIDKIAQKLGIGKYVSGNGIMEYIPQGHGFVIMFDKNFNATFYDFGTGSEWPGCKKRNEEFTYNFIRAALYKAQQGLYGRPAFFTLGGIRTIKLGNFRHLFEESEKGSKKYFFKKAISNMKQVARKSPMKNYELLAIPNCKLSNIENAKAWAARDICRPYNLIPALTQGWITGPLLNVLGAVTALDFTDIGDMNIDELAIDLVDGAAGGNTCGTFAAELAQYAKLGKLGLPTSYGSRLLASPELVIRVMSKTLGGAFYVDG